jgi:hypothetical protein
MTPMNNRLFRPTRPATVSPKVISSYGSWIAYESKFSLDSDYQPPYPWVQTEFVASTIHFPRIEDGNGWIFNATNYANANDTLRDDGYGLGQVRYHDFLNDTLDNINLPQFWFPVTGFPSNNWRLAYRGGLRNGQGFRLVVRDKMFFDSSTGLWNSAFWLLQAILHNNQLRAYDTFIASPDSPTATSETLVNDLYSQFFAQNATLVGPEVYNFVDTLTLLGYAEVFGWF